MTTKKWVVLTTIIVIILVSASVAAGAVDNSTEESKTKQISQPVPPVDTVNQTPKTTPTPTVTPATVTVSQAPEMPEPTPTPIATNITNPVQNTTPSPQATGVENNMTPTMTPATTQTISAPQVQGTTATMVDSGPYAPNRVIVKFKPEKIANKNDKGRITAAAHAALNSKVIKDFDEKGLIGYQVVQLPEGISVQEAIDKYKKNQDIEIAEPDYVISVE